MAPQFLHKLKQMKACWEAIGRGEQPIFLDYPIFPRARWGFDQPAHPELDKIFEQNRADYEKWLRLFVSWGDFFASLSDPAIRADQRPIWVNEFLPGLDAISLCGFLKARSPKRYFEIGSGNSTKFAHAAIDKAGLSTEIVSVDPSPRAEVDALCSRVVRQPLEQADLAVFGELERGDILFVDNSHRAQMNSDATVVFLDILPRLKPGVLVGFHDIFLPYDYPDTYRNRFYSEQYMLAAWLLGGANSTGAKVILPNTYVVIHPDLNNILTELYDRKELNGVKREGSAFWIEI